MPNLHVLFLQVVVGLVAVTEAAPFRRHAQEARNDAVSFHQHQGRADSSYLDAAAAAAPLAAPPSLGFNTDRMERWEDRDSVDEEMDQELERWYEHWHEFYEIDDNTYNDNDYDGDGEDNDFGPYPTTYSHLLVGKRSSAPFTREDYETLYPLTSSLFHIGSDSSSPPPPPSRKLTYPPPRPPSSVPGAVVTPALSSLADALTSSQAGALTSLHKEHVAQFAVLNGRFRKQVSDTKEKHAKNIADILGVPFVEVGKSGRPKYVDLDDLSVEQTRELVVYSQFVEFELRALFQKQMGERVGLLRTQRSEWSALQQKFGVSAAAEGEGEGGQKKDVYWGGLEQGDVSYYGDWLEKKGGTMDDDNGGDEGVEWWMGKSKNRHGAKY